MYVCAVCVLHPPPLSSCIPSYCRALGSPTQANYLEVMTWRAELSAAEVAQLQVLFTARGAWLPQSAALLLAPFPPFPVASVPPPLPPPLIPLPPILQSYFDTKYFLTCPAIVAGGTTNFTLSGTCTSATDSDACTMTCTAGNSLVAGAGRIRGRGWD